MLENEWDDNQFPLAYLITIRTYGTWLHGDKRGSMDRHGKNIYGSDKIMLDPVYSVAMERNMSSEAFLFGTRQRSVVETAIRDVCLHRGYGLAAVHVRTNHAHIVSSAQLPPEPMMNAFKANATRALRETGLTGPNQKVWSRGGSTKYLWRPSSVERAIDYTINGQGDDLPDF